jgi:hypothetical protein
MGSSPIVSIFFVLLFAPISGLPAKRYALDCPHSPLTPFPTCLPKEQKKIDGDRIRTCAPFRANAFEANAVDHCATPSSNEPLPRIELGSQAPETCVLATALRGLGYKEDLSHGISYVSSHHFSHKTSLLLQQTNISTLCESSSQPSWCNGYHQRFLLSGSGIDSQ